MKKLLWLLLLLEPALHAQVVGPGFLDYVTSVPSGTCSQGQHMQQVLGSGDIYTCASGTWAKAGGSGAGTVSSVSGTTNQINVATGTTTPVLSISSTFAFPGTAAAATLSQNNNSTQIATTAYTDLAVANAVAGVNPAVAVLAASTANVTGSYNNGASGVGAFFTVTATGAFSLDGVAINTIGQRVLLKDQTTGFQNGVYTATVVGALAVSPVFTRALDYNQPSDINSTGAVPVQSGTVNGTTSWLLTSTVTTVGTDALTYTRFSISPAVGGILRCYPGLGDGLNAIAAGTYLQTNCYNNSGVTWTITRIGCFTDNSGTSTLSATNGAGTALLTGAVTCTTAAGGAAGTQSATVTIANGDVIKFSFVADGTSKQSGWFVSLTQ